MTDAVETRRPLGAAALSLLTPGLGQLYNGMPKRATIFFAINFTVYLLLNALTSSAAIRSSIAFFVAAILVVLWLGYYLLMVGDAWRGAHRTGQLELRRYNRWYVYLLAVACAAGLNFMVGFTPIHTRSFSLPAASMAPTLIPGDRIFVASNAYRPARRNGAMSSSSSSRMDLARPSSNGSSAFLAIGSISRTGCCT